MTPLTNRSAKPTPSTPFRTAITTGAFTNAQATNTLAKITHPRTYIPRRLKRPVNHRLLRITGISTNAPEAAAMPTRKGPPPRPTILSGRKLHAAADPIPHSSMPTSSGARRGAARNAAPIEPKRPPISPRAGTSRTIVVDQAASVAMARAYMSGTRPMPAIPYSAPQAIAATANARLLHRRISP